MASIRRVVEFWQFQADNSGHSLNTFGEETLALAHNHVRLYHANGSIAL